MWGRWTLVLPCSGAMLGALGHNRGKLSHGGGGGPAGMVVEGAEVMEQSRGL